MVAMHPPGDSIETASASSNEKKAIEANAMELSAHLSDDQYPPLTEESHNLRRIAITPPLISFALCFVKFAERASYYGARFIFANFIEVPLLKGTNCSCFFPRCPPFPHGITSEYRWQRRWHTFLIFLLKDSRNRNKLDIIILLKKEVVYKIF